MKYSHSYYKPCKLSWLDRAPVEFWAGVVVVEGFITVLCFAAILAIIEYTY